MYSLLTQYMWVGGIKSSSLSFEMYSLLTQYMWVGGIKSSSLSFEMYSLLTQHMWVGGMNTYIIHQTVLINGFYSYKDQSTGV